MLMSSPAAAPSIENITAEERIAALIARIERLEAIIDLYLAPSPDLFSEDVPTRLAIADAVERKRNRNAEKMAYIDDVEAELEDINGKLGHLMHIRKPGAVTDKRLHLTDKTIVDRGNLPVTFSEMGKIQEFPQGTRRQNMTKLGKLYAKYPDRYEIRESKLGGKTIKLTSSYFKHLTKEGV